MKKIILAVFCLLAMTTAAEARYVDYPGSWTVMQMNDEENNLIHIDYTVAPNYSVGYNADYWREEKWHMHVGQIAYLLKRWNLTDAQANVYLRGGLGAAFSDYGEFDDKTEFAGYGGVAFDAENRRLYMAYENRYVEAGDIFEGFEQKVRFGVAPYIAEYGALHTWVILQVDHRPEMDDDVTFTPMLRFFKGDLLAEIGISDNGKPLFNIMIRF